MRMDGQEESDNVEDRRGGGGGRGGMGVGGRGIGLGSIVIALVAGWAFGINPLTVLGLLEGGGAPVPQEAAPGQKPPPGDAQARFVSQVLRSTEQVWTEALADSGVRYRPPTLVIFSGSTSTGGCGEGQQAMGPFYCPADEKIYIDLAFYETLRSRLGAPGDFAQAYVVAHEVGHHVQHLLGATREFASQRRQASRSEQNRQSVRLELQADCYAGVWAQRSQALQGWRLEPGDIEEAIRAAGQIGDDTLQAQAGGRVRPDSFTHGSSEQRIAWFRRGQQTGQVRQCETSAVGE